MSVRCDGVFGSLLFVMHAILRFNQIAVFLQNLDLQISMVQTVYMSMVDQIVADGLGWSRLECSCSANKILRIQ